MRWHPGPIPTSISVASPILWRACLGAIVSCGVIAAAQTPESRAARNLTKGCVEGFDAMKDYFPDKVTLEDAANVRIEYRRFYKIVTAKEVYAGGPRNGTCSCNAARRFRTSPASWPALRS